MAKRSRMLPVVYFVVLAVIASCARGEELAAAPSQPPSSTATRILPSPTIPSPTETAGPESQIVLPSEPPAWLGDAAVNVLAAVIGDWVRCGQTGNYALLFLNAETGEQFEVTVPPARAMMWLDSTRFGLLSMDGHTIVSIDFADGSLGTTSFEAEGIRLLRGTEAFPPEELGCTMTLGIVRDDPSGEGPIIFMSPRASYSADLSLFAEGNGTALVFQVGQVGTGSPVWSSDIIGAYDPDETDEFVGAWSPVDPTSLAVIQCEVDIVDCQLERLFVVDVARGEEVASYPGQYANVSWSLDGSKIFFRFPSHFLYLGSFLPVGPPCVLDLATGQNECFWEVGETHFPEEARIILEELSDLRWNRRGDGVVYTYRMAYYPLNNLGTPGPPISLSGLCHFDLATREIDCPSDNSPELQGGFIHDSELSPDEQFAYVQVSGASIAHGVLDLRSHRFFQLPNPPGSEVVEPFDLATGTGFGYSEAFPSVSVLWRPSVGEPPEPAPANVPLRPHASRPTERDLREGLSIWESYGLDDELAPVSPGTRRFSVRVSPGLAFTWSYYWCALGPERLAANLESIAVDFAIDGSEVSPDDILEFEATSGEWTCRYWATMLSDWEPGSQASLLLTLRLDRSLSDGADSYAAGDYSFEILAYVDD